MRGGRGAPAAEWDAQVPDLTAPAAGTQFAGLPGATGFAVVDGPLGALRAVRSGAAAGAASWDVLEEQRGVRRTSR